MKSYVAQYRAEGIFTVRCSTCQFDSFRDGCTERTLMIRSLGQDVLAGTGGHGRRRSDLCTEGLHDAAAIWLLVVADFYLIYRCFETEYLGGIREGSTPLTGTCFGRDIAHAFFLAIISLGDGRVQLVRADGAYTFVLEVDVCRSAQCLFQSVGTHQWSGTPILVIFAYGFGNFNPGILHVEFLMTQFLGKDRVEVFRLQGFLGFRVQWRHRLVFHIRLYVIPESWNFVLWQDKSFLFCAHILTFY